MGRRLFEATYNDFVLAGECRCVKDACRTSIERNESANSVQPTGGAMDFIERIFGIAPDGGSGSLEAMLFILPVGIAVIVVAFRNRSRFRRRP
jgi:hypothetical protein